MQTIAYLVTTHQRHALAADVIRHVCRLRDTLLAEGTVEIRPLVVMSIEDVSDLARVCRDQGVDWIAANNKPVSSKHQVGVHAVQSFDTHDEIDGIMYAGSDDFVSAGYVRQAVAKLAAGSPGVGPSTVWFLDAPTGRLGKWQGPMQLGDDVNVPAGVGRLISRAVLDNCNWCLWPFARNQGLDTHSSKHLATKGVHLEAVALADDDAIVDVKTDTNIHSWREFEIGRNFAEVLMAGPRRDAICAAAGVPEVWYKSATPSPV